MKRITMIGLVVLVVIVLAGLNFTGAFVAKPNNKEELAKHLTENDAVMYGAFWCPNCAEQKKAFGSAFKHINYIECDERGDNAQPGLCQLAGIQGYPTWIIKGQKYVGYQTPERLAQISGFEGEL